ncbi:hypothetical protein ACWGI0_11315 [Streptomyces sp. NPDC054802]
MRSASGMAAGGAATGRRMPVVSELAGDARERLQPFRSPQFGRRRGFRDAAGQAGIIGIGLAAVLTFALAQGSWQWFATFIGVTLLAVVHAFY